MYTLRNPIKSCVERKTTPTGIIYIGGYTRENVKSLGILDARTFKRKAWAEKYAEKAAIAARKQDVESFAKMIQNAANSPSS